MKFSGELAPVQSLVASKLKAGVAPLEVLQLGFQTILCSPGFLYMNLGEGNLNEIARRLGCPISSGHHSLMKRC